ncbi:MAG: PAS domain S-box protein, partial [Desulfatibacillaceae bacterium]|nr:PAS domain S-box protein [Desulfatibacillaceae bacterium]
MKLPPSPNSIFTRIKNRLVPGDGEDRPSYEELAARVVQLEEEAAKRRWTAGLVWENEDMFNRAFRENPDAIAILRRDDATIIDVNPGFTSLLDYTAEQVAGKSPDDLNIWVSSRDRKSFMTQLGESGQVIGMEARFRDREGNVVFGLISAWPIEILGDPCIMTITRNLTERKHAEHILRLQRDLGISLSEARDLKEAASRILKASFNVFGVDCGAVYVVDNAASSLELVTYSGLPRSFASKVRHYPPQASQTVAVMGGRPVYGLYSELADDNSPDSAVRAMALIPVEHEGRVVAAINLGSHTLDRFPKASQSAMEGIVARMGGVIARLEAEAALAESEERFSTFMDTVPGMAFMKDENGHFLYTNRYMAQTFGKKKWLGKSMHDLFDEKTAERLVSEDLRAMSQGPMETFGAVPDKDGNLHHYHTFKFPILRDDKPPILGGIAVDITRQVEAETDLRRALQQLRAVFNTFPGGVKVVDTSFNVVDVSDRLMEMCGLVERKSLVGEKCHKVFQGRENPCPFCSVPTAIKEDRLVTRLMADDEFVHRNEEYKVYTHPIRDDKGRIWGAIECIMDVSDLRAAERQVRNALEEKELLLKEVHHRVKNNMQVILALLTLQGARVRDKDVKGAFADMQNRIKAMSLVHETLYRAENLAGINLEDYAHTVAESLFKAFGAKERGISLSIKADGVTLGVDKAVPCGMIINELFTNALKHAFPNGGPGEIRLLARQVSRGTMELVIADNGAGMPQSTDISDARTLGLGLVTGLVKSQLEG